MSEFPHLSNAPIIEALIFLQADLSASWNPKALRERLEPCWPRHQEIQEMQTLRLEVKVAPGSEPEQQITTPGIDGLMFRSAESPTVYQARRDGFIASWLKPYPSWDEFQADALSHWEQYRQMIGTPSLHSVIVKFINRLEFPLAIFEPEKFFTTHPPRIPELGWQFGNLVQQTEYWIPGTNFNVQTVLARAFDANPELTAYILDIEVKMREPLSVSGQPVEEVLTQMRQFKNMAFFNLLTKEAWERYL